MKLHRYTLLLLMAFALIPAVAQTEDFETQMEALLRQYDTATDAAGRQQALDAMNELDKKYKAPAVMQLWNNLDEAAATGAECRRVGIAMASAGEKKANKWCFKKGAELGDPYCANRVLIEQLTELNNPEAAMYLFPKIKFFTLPLLHNMALAMYVLDTPESRKIAGTLAGSYFELCGTEGIEYDVFGREEYVFYADDALLKQVNKCWQVSRVSDPGSVLRKFYESK